MYCINCELIVENVDVRRIEAHSVKQTKITQIISEPLTENTQIYWFGESTENKVKLTPLKDKKSKKVFNVPANSIEIEYFTYFDRLLNVHNKIFLKNKNFTEQGKLYFDKLEKFIPKKDFLICTSEQLYQYIFDLENTECNLSGEELLKAYDDERNEFFDSIDVLKEKIKDLAKLLKESVYPVFYSGAGISTSANIPDYRGPKGVWTLREKGKIANIEFSDKHPTFSHYAITELARHGLVKFVQSTNLDGLHLRSGLPAHLISEQHGNKHKEICEKCGYQYYRQFDTGETVEYWRLHFTGRNCTFCNGRLKDSIIHFSEDLREDDMLLSLHHAHKSDLSVVLGTSMNVQPAASFPDKCIANNGKVN